MGCFCQDISNKNHFHFIEVKICFTSYRSIHKFKKGRRTNRGRIFTGLSNFGSVNALFFKQFHPFCFVSDERCMVTEYTSAIWWALTTSGSVYGPVFHHLNPRTKAAPYSTIARDDVMCRCLGYACTKAFSRTLLHLGYTTVVPGSDFPL